MGTPLVLNKPVKTGSIVSGRVMVVGAILPDIDIEQAYFWTATWQSWEREADEDLAQGRHADFDDLDSLLKDLNE